MRFQECVDFATKHPVCSLATADGDQPRVRTFLLWRANENGFYFETLNPKDVYNQLKNNPKVEICFFNNESDLEKAKTMRLSGEVEFLDDPDLKKQMDDILKEKEIERVTF